MVLVERWQLSTQYAEPLLFDLQRRFQVPAMLVARDDSNWTGVRAYAHLNPAPYLEALLGSEDIDWHPLADEPDPELPF